MLKRILFIIYCITTCGAIIVQSAHANNNNHTMDNQLLEDAEGGFNRKLDENSRQQIAERLGWIFNEQDSPWCLGCYQEPRTIAEGLPGVQATRISADEASLIGMGRSRLQGDVVIDQVDRQIKADKAYVYRNEEGEVTTIELVGNVSIRQPGQLIYGDRARLNVLEDTGVVDNVLYRIRLDEVDVKTVDADQVQLCGLTAWGRAEQANQLGEDLYEFTDVTFTSCPPWQSGWETRASRLVIDEEKNEGHAYGATFRVKDIPFFYFPYYNFPLDDSRKSGFLVPLVGASSRSGVELGVPYYWNIAPNYDATIIPTYYSKRGMMLGGNFRYLLPSSEGRLNGTYIGKDRAFRRFVEDNPVLAGESDQRGSFAWKNFTQLNRNWTASVDYNTVSDDYYLQDFSKGLESATENQLLQKADVRYSDRHWNFMGKVQRYQTLQPFDEARTSEVYSTYPQLVLNANYPAIAQTNFDFRFNSEYTNFVWPGETVRPDGHRLHLSPILSMPNNFAAGYVTPRVQLHQTNYQLSGQPDNFSNEINRTLPITSVDTGIFFERNTQFLGQNYTQTLEPRLFYLYVPFVEQSQIPDFDSGYNIFTYDQLFRTNRFSGFDRVGDANQMALALTTRYLDNENGGEKFRASVGQLYYFRDRRVMLTNSREREENLVGFTPMDTGSSPIAGELAYRFNPNWYTIGNVAWDPNTSLLNNSMLNFYYNPNPQKNDIINFGYSYLENGERGTVADGSGERNDDLHQTNVSFSWQVNEQWNTLGTWSYNISKRYSMEYYAGVEYESCCWAFRALVGQTFNRLDQDFRPVFNKGIYFQVLLKGVGTFGISDPTQIITNNIPGYRDRFR